MKPLFKTWSEILRSPLVWLSFVAAILYSSWPWGYLLDPSVERHSLASELEAPHRPYNWVFIAMDVATGLLLVGIGLWQHRQRQHWVPRPIIWGYILFGVLVAVAALTPLVCDPTTQSCGPILHNSHLLIHGFASIASVTFLLFALLGMTLQAHKRHSRSYSAIGLSLLLLGWLYFAVGSICAWWWNLHTGNSMQDFFITLCSLSIFAVVAQIELHKLQPVHDLKKLDLDNFLDRPDSP